MFLQFILASLIMMTGHAQASPSTHPYGALSPFTTDGCTDFIQGPDSEPLLWRHCCVDHDRKYWAGGTYLERIIADRELQLCVIKTGNIAIADLMYAGVRLGGNPYLPTPWRWGYGWELVRGYSELTPEEQHDVEALTPPPESPINLPND